MNRPDSPPLYHYTCAHSAPLITEDGHLRPVTELVAAPTPFVLPLVWLTDMATPDRYGLGLTRVLVECDRTEHRFTVERTPDIAWWPAWRNAHPEHWNVGRMLERADGARPSHWWVSEKPVPVVAHRG